MRSKPSKAANGTTLGDLMQERELENQEGDKGGVTNVDHPHTTRPLAGENVDSVTDMGTCPQHAGRTLLTKTAKGQPRVHSCQLQMQQHQQFQMFKQMKS